MGRRLSGWLLLALGFAVAAAAVISSRSSRENDVRAPLDAVIAAVRLRPGEASAARAARLEAALTAAVAPDAVVRADDLPELGADRGSLLAAARTKGALLPELSLDDVELRIAPDAQKASVLATLLLSTPRQSEPVRRTRKLLLALERRGEVWMIVSIEVPLAPRDEPEARP